MKSRIIKHILKYAILMVSFLAANMAEAQTDTAAMVNEFFKVMNFASQPQVFYDTRIQMSASPVLQGQDTMSINGVFYKNGENIYAQSGDEETFLQDGFFIQVNKTRKSIWVSKSNDNIKKELGQKTITKQLDALFRRKYTIQKTTVGSLTKISFDIKGSLSDDGSGAKSTVSLQYDPVKYLPKEIGIQMFVREEAGEELKDALKNEGINLSSVLQVSNGKEYFVRTQEMKLLFTNIYTNPQNVENMPLWKSWLEYDESTGNFIAKGKYSDYEVTRLF